MRPNYLIACLLVLAGCSSNSVKDTLGLSRSAPDEFRVVSRPPLSVPPQFNLQPPGSSEIAPAMAPADIKAKSMITGTAVGAVATQDNTFVLTPDAVSTQASPLKEKAAPSSPEAQFLKNAGADKADARVRSSLTEEKIVHQQQEEESNWWDVWGSNPAKKEPTVDAKKEAERIKTDTDEGKPVTEGETPNVKTKDTGVLGRVLGY